MRIGIAAAAAALLATMAAGSAPTGGGLGAPVIEQYLLSTFGTADGEWKKRIAQDETQRVCTEYRNSPPAAQARRILQRERSAVVFPPEGHVLGDWKSGERIAHNMRGGRFSDEPGTVNGGSCFACHQLSKSEPNTGGMLGPPLINYGRERNFDPRKAREAYVQVFDPDAVRACSIMPRFGYHAVLTQQQIMDVVGYLFDPASPVNQ